MAYASVDDLQSRWRALSPDEQELADVLLEDAEVYLANRYPAMDDDDICCMAACDMVRHAMTAAANAFGLDALGADTAPWAAMASAGDMWLSKSMKELMGGGSRCGFARIL